MSLLIFGLTQVPASAEEKILKVGVIGPHTGGNARTGGEMMNGVKMAFEDIEYKIGDYTVELIPIDTQSDPIKGTNAYAEAVERKGVQATLSNWHSSVAASLMELAAKYKVPEIGAMGAAGVTTEKYKEDPKFKGLWMKGYPVPAKVSVGYVDSLEDALKRGIWKPAKKVVAIYGDDTDWGRDFANGVKIKFQEAGWEIATEDFFSRTQSDFYPLVSKYKKASVVAIAGSLSDLPTYAAFVKNLSEVGLKSVLIVDGLGWFGEWYKLTGERSNYILDMQARYTTPEAKKWVQTYEKRFGFPPGPVSAALPYDYAHYFIKIAKRTLEKHGKIDKSTLHEVILKEVCTGKLTYGQDEGAILMKRYGYSPETYNDPLLGPDNWYIPVIQYFQGQGHIVYPPSAKEQDFKARE
jgi:branched-chain amino acid transport system substrate-binding protein